MKEVDSSSQLKLFVKGERRLMLAVFEDACRCYVEGSFSSQASNGYLKARHWIDEKGSAWPFSFEAICEEFELDPESLRTNLRKRRVTAEQNGLVLVDKSPTQSAIRVEETRPRLLASFRKTA